MGNIFLDIVEDVNVRPNKFKLILKWVVRISIILIGGAFIVGQFNITHYNRLNDIEENLQKNSEIDVELREDIIKINSRIDNIYDDGYRTLNEYQQYNNKQLELIIDYSHLDKNYLKRMLDINSIVTNKSMEFEIQKAKKNNNYYVNRR